MEEQPERILLDWRKEEDGTITVYEPSTGRKLGRMTNVSVNHEYGEVQVLTVSVLTAEVRIANNDEPTLKDQVANLRRQLNKANQRYTDLLMSREAQAQ